MGRSGLCSSSHGVHIFLWLVKAYCLDSKNADGIGCGPMEAIPGSGNHLDFYSVFKLQNGAICRGGRLSQSIISVPSVRASLVLGSASQPTEPHKRPTSSTLPTTPHATNYTLTLVFPSSSVDEAQRGIGIDPAHGLLSR